MDIPQIRRRISHFISGEEGKVSKQSLLSMGAFLGSVAIASSLASQPTKALPTCGGDSVDTGCSGDPVCNPSRSALTGHNAYDASGNQVIFSTGICGDDNEHFHFNGTDFSYTSGVLTAQHHHHGSHNSY
jgi:hypothetical protein